MRAQECGCIILVGTGMAEETQSPGCHSEQLRCTYFDFSPTQANTELEL